MLPFILAATFFLAFSAELFAQSAGLIEAAKKEGGKVVAYGSPFEVAQDGKRSHTARFLREYLNSGAARPARAAPPQQAIA